MFATPRRFFSKSLYHIRYYIRAANLLDTICKFFQGFFKNRYITSVITLEQQTGLTRFVNFLKVFFKIASEHPLLH